MSCCHTLGINAMMNQLVLFKGSQVQPYLLLLDILCNSTPVNPVPFRLQEDATFLGIHWLSVRDNKYIH